MLSTLCNLCRVMAENKEIPKKFENEETQLFVLSVMVRFHFAFRSLQQTNTCSKSTIEALERSVKYV